MEANPEETSRREPLLSSSQRQPTSGDLQSSEAQVIRTNPSGSTQLRRTVGGGTADLEDGGLPLAREGSRVSRLTGIMTPSMLPVQRRHTMGPSSVHGDRGAGSKPDSKSVSKTPTPAARHANMKFIADHQKIADPLAPHFCGMSESAPFGLDPRMTPAFQNAQPDLSLRFGATPEQTPPEEDFQRACDRKVTREEMIHGFVYGMVNFVMCVPVLVSYTYIVFADPEYSPYIPGLYKIMLLSSALCQFVFCIFSQMPFAVGQVQDVGLIFLQAMTRLIQEMGNRDGISEDAVVATALVMCGISTFLTGLIVFVAGRFKIGDYVRLLPLPVVGGYLGYIGYFCLVAGLSVTTGEQIQGPNTYYRLLNYAYVWKLTVCAVFTFMMYYTSEKCTHWLASPALFLLIPILSNLGIFFAGYTHTEAEQAGWFPPPDETSDVWSTLQMYDLSLVQWHYIPQQVGSMLGLFVVVSFGSSLDICAIQSDYPVRLNFNMELETVGLANMASGMFGGFTGSYIFTQTLFSMKGNVRSMANGAVIGFGELLMFMLPLDVTPYLPNAYVGAILCFFGLDILADWLYRSRKLVSRQEFFIIWFTFLCVVFLSMASSFGVLEGMVLGCMLASVVFTVLYARVKEETRSRAFLENLIEVDLTDQFLPLDVRLDTVSNIVPFNFASVLQGSEFAQTKFLPQPNFNYQSSPRPPMHLPSAPNTPSPPIKYPSVVFVPRNFPQVYNVLTPQILEGSKSTEERCRHEAILKDVLPVSLSGYIFFGTTMQFSQKLEKLIKTYRSRFVVLDMRRVVAIDSTAAMALTSMQKLFVTNGVGTILTNIKREGEKHRMLVAHGMITPDQRLEEHDISVDNPYPFAVVLPTVQSAMVFCEELLLQHYGLEKWCENQGDISPNATLNPYLKYTPQPSPVMSPLDERDANLPTPRAFCDVLADLVTNCNVELNESDWQDYVERVSVYPGKPLFLHGDDASQCYFLAAGTVISSCDNADASFRKNDSDLDLAATMPTENQSGGLSGTHQSNFNESGFNSTTHSNMMSPSTNINRFPNSLKGVSSASTQGLYPEPLSVASAGHLVAGGSEQEQMSAMRLPRWRLTKAPSLIGAFIFMADSSTNYGYDCRAGMRGAVLYKITKQRMKALESERPDLAGLVFKAILTSLCEVWNTSHGSAFIIKDDM